MAYKIENILRNMQADQNSESYIAVLTFIYIVHEFSLDLIQQKKYIYEKIIHHLILKDNSFYFQTLHTCFDSYKKYTSFLFFLLKFHII